MLCELTSPRRTQITQQVVCRNAGSNQVGLTLRTPVYAVLHTSVCILVWMVLLYKIIVRRLELGIAACGADLKELQGTRYVFSLRVAVRTDALARRAAVLSAVGIRDASVREQQRRRVEGAREPRRTPEHCVAHRAVARSRAQTMWMR